MQDAPAIDVYPKSDMDWISALAKLNAVALYRVINPEPPGMLRVIAKQLFLRQQVFRVWHIGNVAPELLLLRETEKGPAVKTVRSFPLGIIWKSDILRCPMHPRTNHIRE